MCSWAPGEGVDAAWDWVHVRRGDLRLQWGLEARPWDACLGVNPSSATETEGRYVWTPAFPVAPCPHLQTGYNHSTILIGLMSNFNEAVPLRCLEPWQAQGNCTSMSVIVTVTCCSHEMKLCTNSAPRDHLPMSGTVAGRGRALLPAPRGWNYPARDVHGASWGNPAL